MFDLYANRDKGKYELKAHASEIRLFIAMMALTRYNQLSRRKLYWRKSSGVHSTAVSKTMSRNRLEEILSVPHLSDNMNLDKQNKMTKIEPFCDIITKRCHESRPNSLDFTVDESIPPLL